MSRKKWTTEKALAEYLGAAQRLGHTPAWADLPQDLRQALRSRGYNMTVAAEHWGMKPNRGRGVREPLPAHLAPEPAPEPTPATPPDDDVARYRAEFARWNAERMRAIEEGRGRQPRLRRRSAHMPSSEIDYVPPRDLCARRAS